MYGFLILSALAIAFAAGWVAQLTVGHRRMTEVNWGQVGVVGIIATGISVVVSTIVEGELSGFGPLGLVLAIVMAFVVQAIWTATEEKRRHEEREHERELTPEGLPGHHQPKKRRPAKRRR